MEKALIKAEKTAQNHRQSFKDEDMLYLRERAEDEIISAFAGRKPLRPQQRKC